jgi:hypothetical protein
MESFTRLFGSLLVFVYHCVDRFVILGHIPLLTRPENIVHFFRDVHQTGAVAKDVLRQRTGEYNRWVEAFATTIRGYGNDSGSCDARHDPESLPYPILILSIR